jgi:membrane protein
LCRGEEGKGEKERLMEKERLGRLSQFFKRDIWRIRQKDLPHPKFLFIRVLRTFIISVRGLVEDKCTLRASALTFYSLLSVVPVVAMIFGIAKGFGFQKTLQEQLLEQLEGQEEVAIKIIDFAQALLENVKGGLVAGIGLVVLFYTIIKILSNIEDAFNDIWGIKKGRSIGRKISDYLSLMLICPIVFVLSSTSTVMITSGVQWVVTKISLLGPIGPAIFFMLKLLPYCIVWVLFTFIYILIPNTKINFSSGVLAGVVAGTMYQLFQWVYINFQIVVSNYNAIYGSFAALPLFFVWLQVSWLIVLFGAEISFAYQNVETFEFEQDCLSVSHAFKRLLALRVVHLLVAHFFRGERPLSADAISHKLEIPIRLVHQILYELVAAAVVSEVKTDDERVSGYQPARDPETLTVKSVIDALEEKGSDDIPVDRSDELQKLFDTMKVFGELIERSPANRRFKEI